jgi:hypothetical protein
MTALNIDPSERRDLRRGTCLVDRGPVPAPVDTVREGGWQVGGEP